MKRFLIAALCTIPLPAGADHLDVIQATLNKDCTLSQYVAIAKDFNETWGKSHGYLAEIAAAVQSNDLDSVYWIGRTANAEAFGKAWDTWRDELGVPKSVAAGLQKRFDKCSKNVGRRGYDIYPAR